MKLHLLTSPSSHLNSGSFLFHDLNGLLVCYNMQLQCFILCHKQTFLIFWTLPPIGRFHSIFQMLRNIKQLNKIYKWHYSWTKNGKTEGKAVQFCAQDFCYACGAMDYSHSCTWQKGLQYFCLLQVDYTAFSSEILLVENVLLQIYHEVLLEPAVLGDL